MLIKNDKKKKCSVEGCDSIQIRRAKDWICAFHLQKEYNSKKTRTKIRQSSSKRIKQNKDYIKKRIEFLNRKENLFCPVTNERTTEIHHKKGRIGNLLNDEKYWIAVSRNGHLKIEANPTWAKEQGFSLNRID